MKVPQNIFSHFPDLLEISKNLPDFTVFYNGPKCGASAPDHFHFQAGNTGFLPFEKEFESLERQYSEILFQNENSKIVTVENYFRRFVAIVSSEKDFITKKFEFVYHQLESDKNEEPMMNILCNFIENKWRVIIFPRNIQHPSHFFKTGEQRIIVGPATVELGGILILPREEDFLKITAKEIEEIYTEVTIQPDKFEKLKTEIKKLEN